MQRLLVIAYYFPPMGLSGVQRIAKFVKYLPAYGWAPTVLTVDPGGYFAFDDSLMHELSNPEITIVRTRAFDPTKLFKNQQAVALPAEAKRKRLSALSQLIFVPDNKIGWLGPATKMARALHEANPFKAILATCPPYTNALIARRISKQCRLPYVLDFRDDWLENPRHVYATTLHKKLHKLLERRCFADAASVITINDEIARAMQNRHPGIQNKLSLVCQGFDPSDFSAGAEQNTNDKLVFVYSGVFYDLQKPDYFLKALATFLQGRPETREKIEARFIGLLPDASQRLVKALNLSDIVRYDGYRSHKEAVKAIQSAGVLWMTVGSGPGQESISTSKLFEYIGTKKPLLGLVPDGAARNTLRQYGASFIAYPEDISGITTEISNIFELWSDQRLPQGKEAFAEQFDRKALTGHLADILKKAVRSN